MGGGVKRGEGSPSRNGQHSTHKFRVYIHIDDPIDCKTHTYTTKRTAPGAGPPRAGVKAWGRRSRRAPGRWPGAGAGGARRRTQRRSARRPGRGRSAAGSCRSGTPVEGGGRGGVEWEGVGGRGECARCLGVFASASQVSRSVSRSRPTVGGGRTTPSISTVRPSNMSTNTRCTRPWWCSHCPKKSWPLMSQQ